MKEVYNSIDKGLIEEKQNPFGIPFPNKKLNPALKNFGFKKSDIMEIREMLLKEIKRQNNEERGIKDE